MFNVEKLAKEVLQEVMLHEAIVKHAPADTSVYDLWRGEVDRQGGSFTQEEINESNTWR